MIGSQALDIHQVIGCPCDSRENKSQKGQREKENCRTERKIWPIPFLWWKRHPNFYSEILSGLVSEIAGNLHAEFYVSMWMNEEHPL